MAKTKPTSPPPPPTPPEAEPPTPPPAADAGPVVATEPTGLVGADPHPAEAELAALRAELERVRAEHAAEAERLQAENERLRAVSLAPAGSPLLHPPAAAPAGPEARDHGFGRWLVHVPAHTAPREVEAASAAEAVEKYKAVMGLVSLPAAPLAERVAHPFLPPPAPLVDLAPAPPAE